ncbi:MAG TPA: hypothetical protein VLA49_01620 [Anaerolineales bacterium]|nr:hypothetical protein [Anaerolineales bacterium]
MPPRVMATRRFHRSPFKRLTCPTCGRLGLVWLKLKNGLRPGDPDTGRRDPNFQFYGESLTGADGVYSFRTVLPGIYEPRPRHIHVKLRLDGEELLTTQFYFGNEVSLSGAEAHLGWRTRYHSEY